MSATIKKITIDNIDIPIIFEKYNQLPIFNLQLVFKNSGYIQDKNKSGLTNLTAKLLNEGTKKDGAVKFSTKLENKAISIHTSNGFETFVIEVSCLKSEINQSLKLLNQLLKDPNTTQKTLEKLKTLQISKLTQKANDFDFLAKVQLKKMIFKGSALENSSSGTIKSLNNITLKDIKIHIAKLFNLNNLIIVLGGDIDINNIKKSIKPLLYNFTAQGSSKLPTINMVNKVQSKTMIKETQQAYIYFASPFNILYNDKDNYKAKVASFILGGSGFGSRLMEEIRVKKGLAYSAYGYISTNKTHSYFTGYLQTKLENQQKAKKLVKQIVTQFTRDGVTKEELNSAKKFLLGSEPLRTETFSQRQNRAFNLYYKGLDFNYPKKELDLIQDLTLDDLNKFIKKHIELKDLSFSIITK